MNEMVTIWRDQESHVHTLTEVQTPYEGGPYYKASDAPVGTVSYGEICTGYNFANNKTVAWESPEFEDYKTMESGNFKPLGGHLGGLTFIPQNTAYVIDDYSRGECTLGQYWRWECKSTYSEDNTLEAGSAKSFAQHILDEVTSRNPGVDKTTTPLIQTQNFAIRKVGTATFYGTRVTKDNVELLNASGVAIKSLMAGSWVWFNFGIMATYGNSKKTHMGIWGISDSISSTIQNYNGGAFKDMDPGYGAYMYVSTGMGTAQYTGNWEDLNIATMPVNGMTQDDAKWGQTGL